MREMVFKNLTSGDKKRRDLFIAETIERNGIRTTTRRHSTYIIGNHTEFCPQKKVHIVDFQKPATIPHRKRHVFIYKRRDTKHKRDSFVCDVVGKFYAVVKNELYPVTFMHSFEVDFQMTN